MLALLLAFSLFLFLTLLGKAVTEALQFRFPIIRSWLLAPSIGLATVVLLTLTLNQGGLPIKSFASWLTFALAVSVVAIFWWRRPILPWKQLWPFLGIALFSLMYTCWPMVLYGLRWVGYMNGDMGTYCLGAIRAINYGFYRIPKFAELTGTDYSQYWWFHHGPGLFRPGADIFLAWLAAAIHLQPLQVSMPMLGALNLSQLFVGASLIMARPAQRRLALSTSSLLAVSPFFVLACVAQVLAQVGGIVLLLGLCTLCMRPFAPDCSWRTVLRDSALIAFVGAALCIYYPEVLPFGILATGGFYGYQLLRGRQAIYPLASRLVLAVLLLLILARQHVFTAVGGALFAFSAGVKSSASQIPPTDFDTMLDPSVFASLFGLQTYFGLHRDPWISITILVGMALLTASVLIAVWYCFKAQPAAFLLLVMVAVGTDLLLTHSAFGLFKLAMFIQPILLLPIGALALRLRGRTRYLAPIVYLAATGATAQSYVGRSTSLMANTSVMLPRVAEADVRLIPLAPDEGVLMDTPNLAGDYVFAAPSIGHNTVATDHEVFSGFAGLRIIPPTLLAMPAKLGLTADYYTIGKALRERIESRYTTEHILGHTVFFQENSREGLAYLAHPALNLWHGCSNEDTGQKKDQNYLVFHKLTDVHDYMVLKSSDKGGPHFRNDPVSRWPVEPDLYRPGGLFYGVGRYLLFEVIHPTPNVRVRIALSRTLMGAGRTLLPRDARLEGAAVQGLLFTGSGCATIISKPIRFFEHKGRSYFALDFGSAGDYFPNEKTGLMRLFNLQIRRDHRQMVGFARDISMVPESEYRSLVRPRAVTSWPVGLLENPGLEFSGIYEDGWVSDQATLILGKAAAGEKLVIRGALPRLTRFTKFGNSLTVLLNGKPIYAGPIQLGEFQIGHTFNESSSENRLTFSFTQMDNLPHPDDRPVAAQLQSVAIVGAGEVIGKAAK